MTKGDLREEWKGIVEEFRGSGLTVAEWSRKHGIRAGKLYYWVAKLRADSRVAGIPPPYCVEIDFSA